MIKKVYIDTSVVGGYFDEEFSLWTKLFFESIQNGSFKIAVSELLYTELANAPEHVRNLIVNIPDEFKVHVEYNEEAKLLANKYIKANIVGQASLIDCRHIATATVNNLDILTSWNFKHIVNLDKIYLYNGINLQYGYRAIEIRTPREILNYEN